MEAATSFCRFRTSYHLTRRLIPQDSSKLLNATQEFTVNVRDSGLNCDPGMAAIHMWEGTAVEIMSSKNRLDFFIIKPTRCTNFTNLFCHETLHVSDSSSVHHQEFIHCTLSNGICQRFSNCGPRTTSGPRVLPLWSF